MTVTPKPVQGRPPIAPEDQKQRIPFTLSPAVARAVQALPERQRSARVDAILRKALIDGDG